MSPTLSSPPRLAAGTFLVATSLFATIFLSFPVLYDTDSYYHLGIARLYFNHGQLHDLPWARFSLMAEGFGDKELFFHWLLAPFAGLLGTLGGRLALALLVGALLSALAFFSTRAMGTWGLLIPFLVCFGSQDVLSRLIRLRPELASLILLLVALECAASRRYRALGVVALVYTLTYTAFHALLLLCLAWFVQQGLGRRRWEWPLVLYPVLGAGIGLLVHPNFPHNLVIWKVQSVDFFLLRHQLDVGAEIGATKTDTLLRSNLGCLVGLALLWIVGRRRTPDSLTDRQATLRDLTGVAALAFGLLYLLGRRFALYAVPFAALGWASLLGPRFPLPRRGRALRLATLATVLVLVLLPTSGVLWRLASTRGPIDREQDWRAAAAAIPSGARVAATWGLGQLFIYFAPQASYLNVLDPVFMAVPQPEAFAAQRALFDSRQPDVPLTLWRDLASDHLLVSRLHQPHSLLTRLDNDPRLVLVHDGLTRLYRIAPRHNQSFLLSWQVESGPASRNPVAPASPELAVSPYPLLPGVDRALEGFVDLNRLRQDQLDPAGCATLSADLPDGSTARYELAPWHVTSVWLDGRLAAHVKTPLYATLGEGIELEIGPKTHVVVHTCLDAKRVRGGFYLHRLR